MHYKNIYNKRGIEPKNMESTFALDELFFSITDPKGIILSSNDVFVRVSKFSRDELIGKPHNIIRHPDMPRTIFRALWDTIKSGKPFVGYVKNMAKDGSYYWVLAAVYPIFDDEGKIKKYISIRLKPSSEFFKLIPDLYKEILQQELKEDMDSAYKLLLEKLKSLGFESYEDFAKRVFFEEIESREKILKKEGDTSCNVNLNNVLEENIDFIDSLCSLQTIFIRINRYFNEIFQKVQTFLDLNQELEAKSNFIFGLAEDIRLLSLNASIESYKVKREGVSFSTLSHEMRKNAEISERKVLEMNDLIAVAKKDIENIGFYILTLKLSIEMIVFFVKEMITNFSNTKISKEKEKEITANINELFQLMNIYVKQLEESIFASKNMLRSILYSISELNILINRLDFIHINGMIESAHTEKEEGGFHIIFSQMLQLIVRAKQEIINLESSLFDAAEENTTVYTVTNIAIQKINQANKRFTELLLES